MTARRGPSPGRAAGDWIGRLKDFNEENDMAYGTKDGSGKGRGRPGGGGRNRNTSPCKKGGPGGGKGGGRGGGTGRH